ncbi:hypothetical protein BTN49_0768 [Candidatus Enterovibrio escicola]|uniref:Uncharacterized protein n=1 Tax=Candidatus Enterovibrio escicola TaxID=1927127 RepID=A0A2A5T6G6_9GAMM|nr:hypothetical protein BTN49_0768 [Candidatus Enterovibrio escacola]
MCHQFCWAHVTCNLQQMAEHSGGGLTSHISKRLVLPSGISNSALL